MTRAIHWAMVREAVTFALAFAGLICALRLCTGCSPQETQAITETVENGAAVAQYKVLLGECRQKGRAAGSMAVYEACADALDADLCRRKSVRCTDGGSP